MTYPASPVTRGDHDAELLAAARQLARFELCQPRRSGQGKADLADRLGRFGGAVGDGFTGLREVFYGHENVHVD